MATGWARAVTPGATTEKLARWVTAHFDVERFEARWAAHDLVPVDAVPFIGRVRGAPDDPDRGMFVASGFKKWGFTHAGAASLLIADALEGEPPDWAHLFDPRRLVPRPEPRPGWSPPICRWPATSWVTG